MKTIYKAIMAITALVDILTIALIIVNINRGKKTEKQLSAYIEEGTVYVDFKKADGEPYTYAVATAAVDEDKDIVVINTLSSPVNVNRKR